ncbi:hypothetical protein BpHYR1_045671 [Brachionus plicatilis]|uniref:Uncharacterized protein n=1 Tax=Brachionus plicatilis TaxID=10195 RepID=A0A3M7PMS3_BRAPC|nr:hypothetical protein BpHYR1_045671 [Brachionus plicatilis]
MYFTTYPINLQSWITKGAIPDKCDKTNSELFIYCCYLKRFRIFGKNAYRRYDKNELGLNYQYVARLNNKNTSKMSKLFKSPKKKDKNFFNNSPKLLNILIEKLLLLFHDYSLITKHSNNIPSIFILKLSFFLPSKSHYTKLLYPKSVSLRIKISGERLIAKCRAFSNLTFITKVNFGRLPGRLRSDTVQRHIFEIHLSAWISHFAFYLHYSILSDICWCKN